MAYRSSTRFFFGHHISAGKAQIVLLALTGGTLGIFSIAPLTLYLESAALLLLELSGLVDSAAHLLAPVIVLATCVMLFRCRSLSLALITLGLSMLIGFSIYNIALLPISSWDFQGFWGVRALDLIEHIDTGTGDSFQYDHPHPITLVVISAWGGMANAQGESYSALGSIWALLAFSTLGGVFIYAKLHGCSRFSASFCCLLFLTIPLFENHLILQGYAELPLISLVTLATIWLSIKRRTHDKKFVALAIALAVIAIYTKNTGFFYSLSIIAAHVMRLLSEKIGERFSVPLKIAFCYTSIALALLFCISVVVVLSLKINLAGITLAGYASFTQSPSFMVLANMIGALVLNSTFGISALLFLTYFAMIYFKAKTTSADLFLVFLCLFYFLGAIAVQLTDHGSMFGSWGSDTSYSRVLLPMIALAPILLVHMIADIKPNTTQRLEQ